MTYEEAKLHKQELEKISDMLGDKLNGFEKGLMGLTPDHIKKSDEFQIVKMQFQKAFAELQKFNIYFTKTFKKESAKERDNKRRQLQR
jgi:hypothetical protein